MEITITYSLLLALIIGLVEVVKRLGVNEKFLPLFAIGFGLILSCVLGFGFTTIIINGLMLGLSAVGLFSSTKNVVEGIRK